jgi:hypothetical protein
MDRHTPIIGQFVSKYVGLNPSFKNRDQALLDITPFHSRVCFDDQYHNESADWIDAYVHEAMNDFDFELFNKWLSTANTHAAFLKCPLFATPKLVGATNETVTVCDVTIPPDEEKKEEPVQPPPALKAPPAPKQSVKVRRPKTKAKRSLKPPPVPPRPTTPIPPIIIPTTNTAPVPMSYEQIKNTVGICRCFQTKGFCSFGERCKFSHAQPPVIASLGTQS